MFPQIALKFFENLNNPAAFEPVPTGVPLAAKAPDASGAVVSSGPETYTVAVAGQTFVVSVTPGGEISGLVPVVESANAMLMSFPAPLAGNVFKVLVKAGDSVAAGQVVLILEAMKMETEIRATSAGLVSEVLVREGDAVKVGETLMMLS